MDAKTKRNADPMKDERPPPPSGPDDFGAVVAIGRAKKGVAPRSPRQRTPFAASGDWQADIRANEYGEPMPTTRNIALILEHDDGWKDKLTYDSRADEIHVSKDTPITSGETKPRTLRDVDLARISVWLDQQYNLIVAPSSQTMYAAIAMLADDCAYDPVEQYLSALQWDKTARLESLLSKYFGAEDSPLHRAIGAMWMISAVARVYEPGCQVDHVLVLQGAQGRGKSSALRALAIRDEWFSDSIPGFNDRKKFGEALRGVWLVEFGELDALSRSDISAAKLVLTARDDVYRGAYAKITERHVRRCVFAATTNEDTFLADATGARRFWPVRVADIDRAAMLEDRDQLWAEAVSRYRAHEEWHITDSALLADAQAAQADVQQSDPWQEPIERYLAELVTQTVVGTPRVTPSEILVGPLKLDVEKQEQKHLNRVARCLQIAGWERRAFRDGTKVRRAYVPAGAQT
jgi:putative DNA primase/helicase